MGLPIDKTQFTHRLLSARQPVSPGKIVHWEFSRLMRRKSFFIFIISVVAIELLRLNYLMPLWADDYGRAGFQLSGIVEAVVSEYENWTGRIFVVGATYLFLSSKTFIIIFDVINAMMFCCMLISAFRVARRRMPSTLDDAVEITIFGALLWLGSDSIAETVLWKTGSIGYLWVVTANLIVIFILTKTEEERRKSAVPFWVVCVSLFSGNGLENVSIAMLGVIVAKILYGKRFPSRGSMFVIFAYAAGSALLLLAPGNFARLHVIAGDSPSLQPDRVMPYCLTIATHYIRTPFFWVLLAALVLSFFAKPRREVVLRTCFLFALSLGSAVALSPLPYSKIFLNRIAFPSDVFMLTAAFTLFPRSSGLPLFRPLMFISFIISIGLVAFDLRKTVIDYEGIAAQVQNREEFIAMAKRNGATEITLPPIVLPSTDEDVYGFTADGRYYIGDISNRADLWANRSFAKYHGLAVVTSGADYSHN